MLQPPLPNPSQAAAPQRPTASLQGGKPEPAPPMPRPAGQAATSVKSTQPIEPPPRAATMLEILRSATPQPPAGNPLPPAAQASLNQFLPGQPTVGQGVVGVNAQPQALGGAPAARFAC